MLSAYGYRAPGRGEHTVGVHSAPGAAGQPLSYDGLVRMFARCAQRAGIRQPWVTPHTLRHTHATKMWEAGMRELALQRRLGHASAESTRRYTRVSDPRVVSEDRAALGEHGADS